MDWSQNSIYVLKRLFKTNEYKKWSNAVESGELNDFPDELTELVERLSGIICSEFEINLKEKDKVTRIISLAALAGKIYCEK